MSDTMMAANLHAVGDLRYEAVPMPVCGEDEVLLSVKFCGICGSDVPRVLRKGTYHFPTIPGHELSGVVEMDPTGEWTGRRVSVFPMLPCRKCEMCKEGTYELCRDYDYYGSRRDGGFAQYLAVKRWNLVPLPDEVSLEEGAMCEPVSVAHHAISRLDIQPGDHVLVSGAGPIGLLAAQWARALGAEKVYLFDIVQEKLDYARKLGFSVYEDGIPVDRSLEGTGFADALTRCLNAVKPHGKLVLMGNPSRSVELSQDAYWQILRKELTVTGTWNSSYSEQKNDWIATVEAMRQKQVDAMAAVSHILPLSECNEAFRLLTDRNVLTNRILLRTDA